MITEAYPLKWPLGWKRTKSPKSSQFGNGYDKPSIHQGTQQIINEMKLFGGKNTIVSTDLKLRQDGLPYSSQKEPSDQGVAVYFDYQGQQKVIACDSFNKIGCNLWAIGKTIKAMRGIDRWGCSEIITKAFTGFTALPQNASPDSDGLDYCYSVLQISKESTEKEIKTAYRELSKKHHPDIIGDNPFFFQIKEAYEKIMESL